MTQISSMALGLMLFSIGLMVLGIAKKLNALSHPDTAFWFWTLFVLVIVYLVCTGASR